MKLDSYPLKERFEEIRFLSGAAGFGSARLRRNATELRYRTFSALNVLHLLMTLLILFTSVTHC